MKSENQNSAIESNSKIAAGDKSAQDNVVKGADRAETKMVGPDVAVKAAEPVVAKKA